MSDEHRFAFLLALRQREKLMAKKKHQRKHKVWVRKLFRESFEKGEYYKLVLDMKLFDHELFFRYFRMLPDKFEELLSIVGPSIHIYFIFIYISYISYLICLGRVVLQQKLFFKEPSNKN